MGAVFVDRDYGKNLSGIQTALLHRGRVRRGRIRAAESPDDNVPKNKTSGLRIKARNRENRSEPKHAGLGVTVTSNNNTKQKK